MNNTTRVLMLSLMSVAVLAGCKKAVKPEAPEKPTTGADDHTDEDVPQEERNAETPPTYTKEQTTVAEPSEPEAGSTNSGGQVYVPGFGYVDNGGGNQVVEDNSIYENGNKIGSMG